MIKTPEEIFAEAQSEIAARHAATDTEKRIEAIMGAPEFQLFREYMEKLEAKNIGFKIGEPALYGNMIVYVLTYGNGRKGYIRIGENTVVHDLETIRPSQNWLTPLATAVYEAAIEYSGDESLVASKPVPRFDLATTAPRPTAH